MKILALDLGKYKTVACEYEAESGRHRFHTMLSKPAALQQLVLQVQPDQVVIEICNIAGWICDLLRGLGVTVRVANTSDDAWRWRKVRRKNDRCDALKLAQLAAVNQLREVYIPSLSIRQWRALIAFRQQLVRRRSKVKNHIRDLLVSEGQLLPRGAKCWTQLGRAHLEGLARPLEAVGLPELWRGQLEVELRQLQALQEEIEKVEEKLHAIASADSRVALLRTVPGVGPRLAEAIVALVDRPERFHDAQQVSAYIGMVPKELDSGETRRRGRLCVTTAGRAPPISALVAVRNHAGRLRLWR
jgi:transposase